MVLKVHGLGHKMDQWVKVFAESTLSPEFSPQNLHKGGWREKNQLCKVLSSALPLLVMHIISVVVVAAANKIPHLTLSVQAEALGHLWIMIIQYHF